MNVENKKLLKDIVFSVLFVAGEGVEKPFIAEKLNITEKELDSALEEFLFHLLFQCLAPNMKAKSHMEKLKILKVYNPNVLLQKNGPSHAERLLTNIQVHSQTPA